MHDSYKKCYTNTFQTVKTICRIHNPSAKKGIGLFYRMFVQSYFHPFFNFSPESIRKCSFIQMRSFRETHLKIYLLPSSYPPIFKKSRSHHTKKLRTFKKTTCTKLKKLVLFLDHVLDMCWILAGWISFRSSE